MPSKRPRVYVDANSIPAMSTSVTNIADIKAALYAALFDDKPTQAICAGGQAEVGVLPGLHVDRLGDIALAISESTCLDLSSVANRDAGDAVKLLDARFVRTSKRFEEALNRVSKNHLTEMGIIRIPMKLNLAQLIMVRPGQSFTWRCGPAQTTSAPNSSFASVLVQIPVQSGLGGILNITHDSNRSEFRFVENSDTEFYAITCLSDSKVTISNPSGTQDSVYLQYIVECKDNGPVPNLDTRKDSQWLLKRAAFLWSNLFQTVPDGDDPTPVPIKLAVCVEGFESYGAIDLKDTKLLDKLEASRVFTSYLALTSKTAAGLRDEQWAASDSNRSITSQIRVSRWVPLGQHRHANLDHLGISDLDNLRGDGKPTSDTWTRKMMLVFWPRAHSKMIDLAGNQPQNMDGVLQAFPLSSNVGSDMDVLLNLWRCERPNPSIILPLLNHVTELGRLTRMLELLVPVKHDPGMYDYGLLSDDHVKTFIIIIKRFGYESVKKHVMPVLQITKPDHLANVIELGQSLVSYYREDPNRVGNALLDIAQLAWACVSDDHNPDPIVITTLTKFLFTAPGLGAELARFAKRMMIHDHLKKHIPAMMNVITKLDIKNANESTRHNVVDLARALMLFPGTSKEDFKSTMLYVLGNFPWDEDLQSDMRDVSNPGSTRSRDPIDTMGAMMEVTVELHCSTATKQAGVELATNLIEEAAKLQKNDDKNARWLGYQIGELLLQLGKAHPANETAQAIVNSMGMKGLGGMLNSLLNQEAQTTLEEERQQGATSEKQNSGPHPLVSKLVECYLGKGGAALNDAASMDGGLKLVRKLWFLLLSAPEMQHMQSIFADNLLQVNNHMLYDALLNRQFHTFSKNPHVMRIATARAKQLDYPPPKSRTKNSMDKFKADQLRLTLLGKFLGSAAVRPNSAPKPSARPRTSVGSGTGSTSGAAREVIVIDSDSDPLVGLDDNDDEIEVVEQVKTSAQVQVDAAAQRPLDDDEDIAMVGVTKETVDPLRDYPHARQHCSVFQWVLQSHTNSQHCAKCYCFVCDNPAKDCVSWFDHCQADEKDKKWVNLKRSRTNSRPTPSRSSSRITRNTNTGEPPRKGRRSAGRRRQR